MDDLIHLEPNEMAIVMVEFDAVGAVPMAVFDTAEEAEKYYQFLAKFYEEDDKRWVIFTDVPHYATAEEAFLADKADEENGITEDFDYYLSGGY